MKFESEFKIGDTVRFIASYRLQQKYGIIDEEKNGKIIAVRFTKAKVFYDIVDDYYGFMFDNIDSALIK